MATRRRTRANGEGGIWHDEKRGRWVGTVTVGYDTTTAADGRITKRQKRKTVTGKTRRQVADRLRELHGAVDAGQEPAPRDLTVGRFLEDWLANVLPGSVTKGTQTNYANIVRLYLLPLIGQKRLRILTARDVTVMLRTLEQEWTDADGKTRQPVSPNTRRLARSVLRRALRWAEAEGMVARNVAALADGVKVGTREGKALTAEQARTFLTYLADTSRGEVSPPTPERLAAAYTVALSLGLRRGELLALTWDDVDLDGDPARVTVRQALKRQQGGLVLEEPKTRQSRRTIHLPASVVASLRRHRVAQAAEQLKAGELWEPLPLGADLVFRTEIGTAVDPDNFRNLTYRLTTGAGIGRWSPHQLRHSAASLLLAQNVPLKVISEVLGHSSIRITSDVYAHLLDEAKAEAATAMECALWG